MALKLHNLKPAKGAKQKKKRLGRGNASGAGNYSGRGMKGQRSRSGGKGSLKLRGMKANIQSLPKLGGFNSLNPKLQVVNLVTLEKNFKDGDLVNLKTLKEKNIISKKNLGVKILGNGKLSKKLTIKVNQASEPAALAIKQAGGKLIVLKPLKKDFKKGSLKKEQGKEIKKNTKKS